MLIFASMSHKIKDRQEVEWDGWLELVSILLV